MFASAHVDTVNMLDEVGGTGEYAGVSLTLPDDAVTIARSMWPLKIGNKSKFVLRGPNGEKSTIWRS